MKICVRKTEEGDWPALKAIRLASLAESPQAFGLSLAKVMEMSEAQWKDRAAGRIGATYFLAWLDAQAVGMIGGVQGQGEYNLIGMWVAPPQRGLGISKELVRELLGHARSENIHEVVLSVAPENIQASALYQKMGFKFIEQFEYLDSHPEIRVQKMVASIMV